MEYKKIWFEDHGQDFLWWVADEQGRVIDCGPFQRELWMRHEVMNLAALEPGMHVETVWEHGPWYCKYPVERIEIVS